MPHPLKLYSKRVIKGMKKCNRQCPACPYIKEGKVIKAANFTWSINMDLNCESSNIIYMIECNIDRCKMRYIGESERKLSKRLSEHRGYVTNHLLSQATGYHFNLPGHNISNMTITAIEKVKKMDSSYRKERERYHIRKFNTYYHGLNRMP